MKDARQYSIGDFAEKTGTSIRTLHYYDEIGLLKPHRQPGSGHRLYTDRDVLTLQRIIGFKFLGYSLEQIREMTDEADVEGSLKQTLRVQQKALEEKREQLDAAIGAIRRTSALLEESGTVDGSILFSLVKSMQTEKEQRLWIERNVSAEAIAPLFDKPDEEHLALDKQYIELSEAVKRLAGRAVDDPEVQELLERYLQASLNVTGPETLKHFGRLEQAELEEWNDLVASPFTEEEEAWFNSAMEHYMVRCGMLGPPV
ncbi:MerR family transcriptional regulator [Paenibacillus hodogayensis]|uniref:MerR family transcriptional regulator n=1 Tax=Paenibacillus hodogayensis TaxID=279208 RepID=A0ABV5VZU8_9BACL